MIFLALPNTKYLSKGDIILKYKVVCILLIAILSTFVLTGCGNREDKASPTLVYQIAQDHVKNHIENPRAAEFPLDKISDHVYRIEGEDNLFIVDSYVIVENVFGGTTRKNFITKVEYLGDSNYKSYNLKFTD